MTLFWFLLMDLVGCVGIALVLTLLTGPGPSIRDDDRGPALIPPPHRPANARSA